MKILAWIIGFLALVVGAVYFLAFTASGNAILQPVIGEKINESTKLNVTLRTFTLRISEFEILLELDAQNSVHAKGTYELLAQSFDANYNVN